MKRISFLLPLIFLCFWAFGQQRESVKSFYSNGHVQSKGWVKNGNKQGIWYFYAETGYLERKEKWKEGIMQWTIIFNEKHHKVKWIDKNGVEKNYKGCNCKS